MAGKNPHHVLTDMSVLVLNKAAQLAFPNDQVKLKHVLIVEGADGVVRGVHCDADVASLKVGLKELLSEGEVKDLILGLTELVQVNEAKDENHTTAE